MDLLAYVDGTTGGMMLQILFGSIIGGGLFLRGILSGLLHRHERDTHALENEEAPDSTERAA